MVINIQILNLLELWNLVVLISLNLISYFKYFNKLPLVCVDKAFVIVAEVPYCLWQWEPWVKTTALHANFEQSIIQFIPFIYYNLKQWYDILLFYFFILFRVPQKTDLLFNKLHFAVNRRYAFIQKMILQK